MRKLILSLIGLALWQWLTAPARPIAERSGTGRRSSGPRRTQRTFGGADLAANASRRGAAPASSTAITYRIVEHDGGWAYKVGDVFSETFPDHDSALEAAKIASREHQIADEPVPIEYQDADGKWRQEMSTGRDRPSTRVEDSQRG